MIDESGHNIRLQVDGGVTAANIKEIAEAGADMFVAGTYDDCASQHIIATYSKDHTNDGLMPILYACLIGSAILKNPRTKDAYAATIKDLRAQLALAKRK